MTIERVFNIFIYFNNGRALDYGVSFYDTIGTDNDKMEVLLSSVLPDNESAKHFTLARSFTPQEWRTALRYGEVLGYFEEAFSAFSAPENPIFCITCIVDGVPTIQQQIGPEPFRGEAVTNFDLPDLMHEDYLVKYTDGQHFRFTDLINDDYFEAIRLLFKAKRYVSSTKLLMSCVDTLAFVEFGDVSGNFCRWINEFVELSPVGITADELWEFRNSILHMTNLQSRKVLRGKISPIIPYVGAAEKLDLGSSSSPKPFNLQKFIEVVANGISKWAESYNFDHRKLLTFIERYDTTLSDARLGYIAVHSGEDHFRS